MKKKSKASIFDKQIRAHLQAAFALLKKNDISTCCLFHLGGDKVMMMGHVDVSDMHPQVAFMYLMFKPVKTEKEIEVYRALLQSVMEGEMQQYFKEHSDKMKFPKLPGASPTVGPNGKIPG